MKQHPTTPHTGNAKFGEALKKLRKTADMSIVDLAKSVGVDQTLLSRIETGASRPPELNTLMRMANALGVPQGSDEFEELWRLAEQERNPGQNASQYIASMKDLTATVLKELLTDLTKDTTATSDPMPVLPVFVPDTTALLARSSEEIMQRGAAAMTVHFADGTSKTLACGGNDRSAGASRCLTNDSSTSLRGALAPKMAALMQAQLGNGTDGTVKPRLFNVHKAALYLGRSKASVQHLIAQRRIPVVRLMDGACSWMLVELDRLIAAQHRTGTGIMRRDTGCFVPLSGPDPRDRLSEWRVNLNSDRSIDAGRHGGSNIIVTDNGSTSPRSPPNKPTLNGC